MTVEKSKSDIYINQSNFQKKIGNFPGGKLWYLYQK